MSIVMIDSGGRNIASVRFALERLGAEIPLTRDQAEIERAEKVLLPGVSAAAYTMKKLKEHKLVECIQNLKQPVLGICLGMQLLFDHSEEGDVDCLGIIPATVKRIPGGEGLRVPHMGWNKIRVKKEDPMTRGIKDGSHMYYLHSYYAPSAEYTLLESSYGVAISGLVRRDNFYGAQFHPERSGAAGSQVLKNFLEL